MQECTKGALSLCGGWSWEYLGPSKVVIKLYANLVSIEDVSKHGNKEVLEGNIGWIQPNETKRRSLAEYPTLTLGYNTKRIASISSHHPILNPCPNSDTSLHLLVSLDEIVKDISIIELSEVVVGVGLCIEIALVPDADKNVGQFEWFELLKQLHTSR
jgi:hypothetical protein